MVAIKRARDKTYEDYLALPEGVKAELIDGELYMSPQPKGRHIRFASVIGGHLTVRVGSSAGPGELGPGGWWILHEPECHLALDLRVVIPDLAGWRRERMPTPPGDDHKFKTIPDWVCEVFSPSTRSRDTMLKMPRYLTAGVRWAWLVDPAERRVEVFESIDGEWSEPLAFEGNVRARIPPFDDIELDLSLAWSD